MLNLPAARGEIQYPGLYPVGAPLMASEYPRRGVLPYARIRSQFCRVRRPDRRVHYFKAVAGGAV